MYNDAQLAMQRRIETIRLQIESNALSEYEKAMHLYILSKTIKNITLSFVYDEDVRNFSRFSVPLTRHSVTHVIFNPSISSKFSSVKSYPTLYDILCTKNGLAVAYTTFKHSRL